MRKARKTVKWILFYMLVAAILAVTLFPICWVIMTSVKYQRDFMASPPAYFPKGITLDHYITAFKMWNTWPYIWNSIIISVLATALVIALSLPAAYAIAKYNAGGSKLRTWLIFQRMLPPVVVVIPIYLIFSKLNLLDTHIGMALPYLIFQIPFAILMLVGFFADIPSSIQEAALVDGCTEMQSLRKVLLPLVRPGIVVVVLFCFVYIWNDMLIALSLARQNTQTIVLLVSASMQQLTGTYFGIAAAMASFAIIPIFLITLFMQKHLVRGMTLGGVKG